MSRHLGLLASTLAAVAAVVPVSAQSPRHDSALPIEITADTLEVQQRNELATFAGNVDAVQGDLTLSADELRVHYQGGDSPRAASGGSGTIRRIEAEGNVFLASPEETAEGATGTYDVERGTLTLIGNVILTRGENVVRGERLVYNVESGRSEMFSAVRSAENPEPGQRVRAILTPDRTSPTQAPTPAPAAGPTAPASAPAPAGPGALEEVSGQWPPLPPGPKPAYEG